MRKTVVTLGLLVVLLVSLFGTVAADSGTEPTVEPTVAPTTEPTVAPTTQPDAPEPGSKFFTHPIVKLLSAYFDLDTGDEETPVNPDDPALTATPEPGSSEDELGPIGKEIAAYHEDGMGFGVLVKIYAMVKASEEACEAQNATAEEGTPDEGAPDTGTCTPLKAEDLVTAVKGGTGMGDLFKEYGKPALLGVGHVKHELKEQNQPTEEPTDGTEVTTKGHKPDKTNLGKGKGPKK